MPGPYSGQPGFTVAEARFGAATGKLLRAALRCLQAQHALTAGTPAYDTDLEHSRRLLALAARDLASEVDKLPGGDQPAGWRRSRHAAVRGDDVEAWLKRKRDELEDEGWQGVVRSALDDLLDDYRLHADTGAFLDTEVCER